MFIVDRDIIVEFSVFSPFLVVNRVGTSATDCLERLVSEITCIVLSGTINSTTTTARHSTVCFDGY